MRVHFPYHLSVGTDIIAHSRLLRSVQSSSSNTLHRLVNRFLHPGEIVTLGRRFPQWRQPQKYDAAGQQQLATWLAGRWAAKEAAKKAWGAHLISFRDLRVEQQEHGGVEVICQSFDTGTLDTKNSVIEQVARLSISHDGDYAIATVMASPLHQDILSALEARKVSIEKANAVETDLDKLDQDK